MPVPQNLSAGKLPTIARRAGRAKARRLHNPRETQTQVKSNPRETQTQEKSNSREKQTQEKSRKARGLALRYRMSFGGVVLTDSGRD